jgi:hypothetical protein
LLTESHHRRLLHARLTASLATAATVAAVLRALRRTLFPSNALPRPPAPPPVAAGSGPSPPPAPDPAALVAAKTRCAATIREALPPAIRSAYLGRGREREQLDVVERWLDVFADPYLNRAVVVRVLELVLVRLMPELADKGVGELLAERLGGGS